MNNYLHRLFKRGVCICARDFVLIPMYPKRERERGRGREGGREERASLKNQNINIIF